MEGESIQGLRQIPDPLPLPPGAAPGPLGRRTETVLVVDQPNVTGRPARKRVLVEQVKHLGRPLEQVPQQGHEPVPGALRIERRKPHLPIEPRHVRRYEGRTARRIARLPAELILTPVQDRKSTRLNSSHGYISYAVFCLKKKK